jgi:hypothetical protein
MAAQPGALRTRLRSQCSKAPVGSNGALSPNKKGGGLAAQKGREQKMLPLLRQLPKGVAKKIQARKEAKEQLTFGRLARLNYYLSKTCLNKLFKHNLLKQRN